MPRNEKGIMVCCHCGHYIDDHNYHREWLHQPGSQRWCESGGTFAEPYEQLVMF